MSIKEKLKDHLWSSGTGIAGIAGIIGIVAATAFVFSIVSLIGTVAAALAPAGAAAIISNAGLGIAGLAAAVTAVGTTAEVFGHGIFKFMGGDHSQKGLIHSVAGKAQNFKPISAIFTGIGTLAGAFLLAAAVKSNEPPSAVLAQQAEQTLQSHQTAQVLEVSNNAPSKTPVKTQHKITQKHKIKH